jgi:hypothetical protein
VRSCDPDLRIKAFYGTSENAVKTQIRIAVSVSPLVAIVRKRLGLQASRHQMFQFLSVIAGQHSALGTGTMKIEAPRTESQATPIG